MFDLQESKADQEPAPSERKMESSDAQSFESETDSTKSNVITRELIKQRFEETEAIHTSNPPNKKKFVYKGRSPVYTRPVERSNAPYIPVYTVGY